MAIIELDHVSKEFVHYRRAGRIRRTRMRTRAVHDVSLEVEEGEVIGYIGPNGAGKSTTIKILTGILVPSSGRVLVAGLDPQRRRMELTRRIGVVFGQRTQLWWDLPLRDSFDLLRYVYRVPAARHRANLTQFEELLDLGPFLDVPVRQLSLGQRMRGELTAALLHEPAIVYLDEPTIGLDVISKVRVREFLAAVNRERGVTVMLTTHDLDDVEQLCRRLVVIDKGRIIHDTTVQRFKHDYAPFRTLVVDLVDSAPPLEVAGAEVTRVEGPRQWLRFRREDITAANLIAAVGRVAPIHDVTVVEPDIEEVIHRVYAENLTVSDS